LNRVRQGKFDQLCLLGLPVCKPQRLRQINVIGQIRAKLLQSHFSEVDVHKSCANAAENMAQKIPSIYED